MSNPLTNTDVLASHGLVEIFDATVGAYRQVAVADARAMLANLQSLHDTLSAIPEEVVAAAAEAVTPEAVMATPTEDATPEPAEEPVLEPTPATEEAPTNTELNPYLPTDQTITGDATHD